MKSVLTIAGSDSSGGAGIQADLKTMCAHGIFGQSVLAALTAQNTTGVSGVMPIDARFVEAQMDSIFTDIYPDAVKIGMLGSVEIVQAIATSLKKYEAKNIVLDPVMVATSGALLVSDDVVEAIKDYLFPMATLITPNLLEAQKLYGREIICEDDLRSCASALQKMGASAVLIKGGHNLEGANDFLATVHISELLKGSRIDNPNTHGTGCTLSSAIACNLAIGYGIHEACAKAKSYVAGAIADGLDLGSGSGPLNHMWQIFPTTPSASTSAPASAPTSTAASTSKF